MAACYPTLYDNIEENGEYLSECTDSECCSSSYSESEEDYDTPWLDKVSSKGDLFYIELGDISNDLHTPNNLNCETSTLTVSDSKTEDQNKSKPGEKLKKWMKKRRKKSRKSFPLNSSKLDLNSASLLPLDTALNYATKDIYIEVESVRQNLGRRALLSEELLGLIVGEPDQDMFHKDRVKILGFVKSKDGIRKGDIRIGDIMKCVNDIEVTFKNLDEVLSKLELPTEVKLTVYTANYSDLPGGVVEQNGHLFVKSLIGEISALDEMKSQCQHIPHGLYYFSIDGESMAENDGVIYRYPDKDTPLFQQKGMLITLSDIISDVASPPLLSCSVAIQSEVVHTGFTREGKEMLLLALPSSCATITEVHHLTQNIAKLLKLEFLTLGEAFKQENHSKYLNPFFAMFFHNCLFATQNNSHFPQILPSVHWFPLPADLKTEIDDILSELESSDFESSSKGFYGNQRLYNILGSSLFYKGYLLNSHLPKDDLLSIHLYVQQHQLLRLTRTRSVSLAIVWKEIFNPRLGPTDPDFEETDGRHFMLIVVMQHSILAVLLETGGCAAKAEEYPIPEPFYVEEVQNTLIILEECGILDAVEKMLSTCLVPLASPDQFLHEGSSTWNSLSSIFTSSLNLSSPNSNLLQMGRSFSHSSLLSDKKNLRKWTDIADKHNGVEAERQQLLSTMGPADGESDVESDYSEESGHKCSTGSESHGSSEYINSQGSRHQFSSLGELSPLPSELPTQSNSSKVVAGSMNTLFHYLHMDPVEGIFLAPSESYFLQGPLFQEVVSHFHQSCLNMRTVFERSLRNNEIISSGTVTKYGINSFLSAAYEQGVLFQYAPKEHHKLKKTLNFWVIGRLFFAPEPREVYVCYHDSAQQDVVEIAFRLGFGLSL